MADFDGEDFEQEAGAYDAEDLRGFYIGEVVNNVDPEKLGRVTFRIEGLVMPESGWAYPLGTMGGGSKERGAWFVPEIGATVGVLFNGGDVDQPWYMAAHWGVREQPPADPDNPNAPPIPPEMLGPEQPKAVADTEVSPEDAILIRTIDTKLFHIVVDERPSKQFLQIQMKDKELRVELDGVNQSAIVQAPSVLYFKAGASIVIDAPNVTIRKRWVQPGPKPI